MKQRLKIGLAILAQKPILLLDEPCTNLDAQGVAWYQALIQNHIANKLIIISSNIPHEYDFCKTKINIQDYKK